jgi:crossover junction endodeoxyribonuclease RuvC
MNGFISKKQMKGESMRTLGIDPGINGALVIIEDGEPIEWMHMPTYLIGSHNRVNCSALGNFIMGSRVDVAIVEKVGAMPGQGVTSMFSFGHAVGSVMGVLGAFIIPTIQVTPQSWKKEAGILNKDKDASRSKAIEIWPNWRDLDKKIKGQALADAALIARYGK